MKDEVSATMVSVIIPVYNGSEFLEECLRSVVAQSYRDLEIIVIDDGSTDNSYETGARFAMQDSRIQLIHQENAGVSAARNRGLSLAGGEYVIFVDADDIIPKEAVENLITEAKETELVIGSHEEFRGKKTQMVVRDPGEFHVDAESFSLMEDLISTPWGKLYKREIIADNNIQFDTSLPYGEDTVFNLRYCKLIRTAKCTSDIVYRFRKGGIASSVRYYPDMNAMNLKLLHAIFDYFDGQENMPQYFMKKKIKDQLISSVMHYVVHCSYKTAIMKIDETLSLFRDFMEPQMIDRDNYSSGMTEAILLSDAKRIVREVFKLYAALILARKLKRLYYRFFFRRI